MATGHRCPSCSNVPVTPSRRPPAKTAGCPHHASIDAGSVRCRQTSDLGAGMSSARVIVPPSHEVLAGSSFMAQEPDRLHFGLGPATSVQWLAIRWADGSHTYSMGGTIDAVNTVQRTAVNATGDLDIDGDTDADDLRLLKNVLKRPDKFATILAGTPYLVLGDIDGDGSLTLNDYTLLDAIVP